VRDVFFEVGFYRLSPKAAVEERQALVEPGLAAYRKDWIRERGVEPPRESIANQDHHLRRSLGIDRPYEYNEIFGWLRLVAERPAVKGYGWRIARRRPRRESPRIFDYIGKLFEVRFFEDEIGQTLRDRIASLADPGEAFAGWHPDLDAFDAVAPLVDWVGLLGVRVPSSRGNRL
jgi:hypothetical protein